MRMFVFKNLFLFWIFNSLFALSIAEAAADSSSAKLQSISTEDLKDGNVEVIFKFDQALSSVPQDFLMKDPTRIVLDFNDVSNATGQTRKNFNITLAKYALLVSTNTRLRVLLYLNRNVSYKVRVEDKTVYLTLFAAYKPIEAESSKFTAMIHQVEDLSFHAGKTHGSGQLTLRLSDVIAKVNVEQQSDNIELTLPHTRLLEKFRHRYDVKDYATPIAYVNGMQSGDDTKIKLEGQGHFVYTAYQINKDFIVDVTPVNRNNADVGSSEQYTGKLISLNFENIQVRSVLQLLAEFTKKNIIISNAVNGSITLALKNVPWDQALDIILHTQGLGKRAVGNVLMIAPVAEITAVETNELQNKQKLADLVPLYSEIFHIKYGNVQTYFNMLKDNRQTAGASANQAGMTGLLSSRGRVIIDTRTNTLFVDDTAEHLELIRKFLNETDVAVRQVMIEARIVAVRKNFEQQFGINIHGGKTPTGGFNMDLGGNSSGAPSSKLGLEFNTLPAGFLLDLELSALESEHDADIISSPRVVTANNLQASIEQGQQIPYQTQAASGGTTTQFVNALLKLDVTPQITPDDKIILKLIVTNDTPKTDPATQAILIDTKKVNTNILVNNGETIVLGGIYERDKENIETRVPFLSSIPILGYLFRSKHIKDNRTELLVFVTPKIVNQDLTDEK